AAHIAGAVVADAGDAAAAAAYAVSADALAGRRAHRRSEPRTRALAAGAVPRAGGGAADPGVCATLARAQRGGERPRRTHADRNRRWLDLGAVLERHARGGGRGGEPGRAR